MKKIVFFILISFKCFSQTEIYDYEWLAMCDAGETNFYRLVLHNPSYGWDSVILTRQYTATPAGFTNYSPSGPVTMGQCVTGGGGGCCETASNVGTDGYGVYEGQTGLNFKFRNIAPGSGKIIVTLDTSQKDIDIDVNIDSLVGISIDQIDSLRYYLGRAQDNILWRYENINVGTAGQWDTVNVDDDYLTLSGSGGKINISHKESIGSLNGLDTMHQNMVTTENGSNFTIASSGNTHEFNLPVADVSTTGKLSAADWYSFFLKVDTSRKILTTSPLTGGGNFSIDRTHALANGTWGDINAASNWVNLKVMGFGGRVIDTSGLADGKIWKYNSSLAKWQLREDSVGAQQYYHTIRYANLTDYPQQPKLNFNDNSEINPIVSNDAPSFLQTSVEFQLQPYSIQSNKIDTGGVRFLNLPKISEGLIGNPTGTDTMRRIKVGSGLAFSGDSIYAIPSGQPNIISPTTITSDQDNYNPTGWDAANLVIIQSDTGFRAITSFEAVTTSGVLIKEILNKGDNPVYIPSLHPDGTASNQINGESDFILMPKTSIRIAYDTIEDKWFVLNSTNRVDYNRNYFQEYTPGSITAADLGFWSFTTSSGSVSVTPAGGSSRTPSTTTASASVVGGRAFIYAGKSVNDATAFGDSYISFKGNIYAYSDTSQSANRYLVMFSITDNANGTNQAPINNSINIIYCDSINGGNWTALNQANGGGTSTLDLGVKFNGSYLYDLEIVIDKLLTEARFYINGIYRGRLTTNLPSRVGCGVRTGILKTTGSAARYIGINGLKYNYIYTR